MKQKMESMGKMGLMDKMMQRRQEMKPKVTMMMASLAQPVQKKTSKKKGKK